MRSGDWINLGDLNYHIHGGTQVRYNDGIHSFDIVELITPDASDMPGWYLQETTVFLDELVESKHNINKVASELLNSNLKRDDLVYTDHVMQMASFIGLPSKHVDHEPSTAASDLALIFTGYIPYYGADTEPRKLLGFEDFDLPDDPRILDDPDFSKKVDEMYEAVYNMLFSEMGFDL